MYITNYFEYLDSQSLITRCIEKEVNFSLNGQSIALISEDKDKIMEILHESISDLKFIEVEEKILVGF